MNFCLSLDAQAKGLTSFFDRTYDNVDSIKWMNEDFTQELGDDMVICQTVGLLVTTHGLKAGTKIPIEITDTEDKHKKRYKIKGTVDQQGVARVVWNMCEPKIAHDFVVKEQTPEQKDLINVKYSSAQIDSPLIVDPELKKSSDQSIFDDPNKYPPTVDKENQSKIVSVKWMTADYSHEIKNSLPCEPVGILIQTQGKKAGDPIHIVIGELQADDDDPEAVITTKNDRKYEVSGVVDADGFVRIPFTQHIDKKLCH